MTVRRAESRVNSQRSGQLPQGKFISPEDVKLKVEPPQAAKPTKKKFSWYRSGSRHFKCMGDSGRAESRVNSECNGELPQGEFISPEDAK